MTSTTFAEKQLKQLVDRIERLEAEKATIAADIKEVFAEAKGNGFDVKILRKIISIRKMEAEERQEQEAMIDLYMSALGMQPSMFDDEPEPNSKTPASQKHAQGHEPAAMVVPQGSEKPDPIQVQDQPTASVPADEKVADTGEVGATASPVQIPEDGILNEETYHRAIQAVREAKTASTAFLHGAMNWSYAVASSAIERMEREGIITAPQANGKRNVIEPEADLDKIPPFMDRRKPKPEYTPADYLAAG